jgi:hypothetical protein
LSVLENGWDWLEPRWGFLQPLMPTRRKSYSKTLECPTAQTVMPNERHVAVPVAAYHSNQRMRKDLGPSTAKAPGSFAPCRLTEEAATSSLCMVMRVPVTTGLPIITCGSDRMHWSRISASISRHRIQCTALNPDRQVSMREDWYRSSWLGPQHDERHVKRTTCRSKSFGWQVVFSTPRGELSIKVRILEYVVSDWSGVDDLLSLSVDRRISALTPHRRRPGR